MCGRYTISHPGDVLKELDVAAATDTFKPRYNVAPTQLAPVIRAGRAEDGPARPELTQMRWGLVPFWAKDVKVGNRMINARAETAAEKPSFKRPLQRSRCLVLADGFYEWRKVDGGKQPFHIHLADRRAFCMAGLWDRWTKGDEPVESFTILTTTANEEVRELHDRMPVILSGDDLAMWLDPSVTDLERLAAVLRPYAGGRIAFHPVSKLVNSPANDRAACLEPVEL